jgi:hypothetical protein
MVQLLRRDFSSSFIVRAGLFGKQRVMVPSLALQLRDFAAFGECLRNARVSVRIVV